MFVVLASGSLVCVHCVGFSLFPCRARRYPARVILGSRIILGKPQEMLFLANEWGAREQAECNHRVRVW